jgi:hypothetical protein
MTIYTHTYSINFSARSTGDSGELTAEEYRAALMQRIHDLDSEGNIAWEEAIGYPFDTREEEDGMPY